MTLVLAAGSRDCPFLLESSPAPSPGAWGERGTHSHLSLGSRGTNQGPCSYLTKISVTNSPNCSLFPSPWLLRAHREHQQPHTPSHYSHNPPQAHQTLSWDKDRINADQPFILRNYY